MTLTVACVLRSGGEYTPRHVSNLRSGFERHLRMPHRFVCLSDIDVPCERIPLRHGWPGWWSKIELFTPRLLSGPVIYADLDTIVVGPVDDIALGHEFTVLENFWSTERIGSGLMAWHADLGGIYHKFMLGPKRFMDEYKTTERWGDQGFIRFNSPVEPARWQRRYPGKVVSFKKRVLLDRAVPPAAAVVCFHGSPRPWQLNGIQRGWFTGRTDQFKRSAVVAGRS